MNKSCPSLSPGCFIWPLTLSGSNSVWSTFLIPKNIFWNMAILKYGKCSDFSLLPAHPFMLRFFLSAFILICFKLMINAYTSCYMLSVHPEAQKHLPTLSHNTVGYLLTFLPSPTMFVFWISSFRLRFSFFPLGSSVLQLSSLSKSPGSHSKKCRWSSNVLIKSNWRNNTWNEKYCLSF